MLLFIFIMVIGLIGLALGIETEDSGSSSATDEPTSAAPSPSDPSPSPDPEEEQALLIKEAEAIVKGELPDIPLWEGTKFKGLYVSDEEVCVDRTYRDGSNAGYVVVTFPDGSPEEPQDGTCGSAEPEEEPEPEPVEVPAEFEDDPGLVTRDDFGDAWPLNVDFGALDCRTAVVGGITLQSVTFRVPFNQYAVNGTARSQTPFPVIDEIVAKNPDIPGTKMDIGPLIDRGLERCE